MSDLPQRLTNMIPRLEFEGLLSAARLVDQAAFHIAMLEAQPNFHFNGLTPAEAERLAYLIEEASEVSHIACKILRHGFERHDPTKPISEGTNRAFLEKELSDFVNAVMRMIQAGDIRSDTLTPSQTFSNRWMHHQP